MQAGVLLECVCNPATVAFAALASKETAKSEAVFQTYPNLGEVLRQVLPSHSYLFVLRSRNYMIKRCRLSHKVHAYIGRSIVFVIWEASPKLTFPSFVSPSSRGLS